MRNDQGWEFALLLFQMTTIFYMKYGKRSLGPAPGPLPGTGCSRILPATRHLPQQGAFQVGVIASRQIPQQGAFQVGVNATRQLPHQGSFQVEVPATRYLPQQGAFQVGIPATRYQPQQGAFQVWSTCHQIPTSTGSLPGMEYLPPHTYLNREPSS